MSGGIRQFSGESEDGKEYRRWKLWVTNKFLTLEKLSEEARGPYLFTLLSGKALEAVEHIPPEDYQKKGGEKVLIDVLDRRFPDKDTTDELAEVMSEILGMRVREGETLKQWIARATELFDKCDRKAGCKFPQEARGFMTLKYFGLNDEQQAVVKGRAMGDLKLDNISKAMRSVYPDFVFRRKTGAAVVVEDVDNEGYNQVSDEVQGFEDVEAFLTDHVQNTGSDEAEEHYEESEVAEILATTWREKRMELSKLQRSRKFSDAGAAKKSFRVEIEELKKRTKCNRCGRVGHWAKECRQPRDPSNTASKGRGKSSSEAAVNYVEQVDSSPAVSFIASVSSEQTLLQKLRSQRRDLNATVESEVLLVSSPGFGVLDSGCGKTIIGKNTLEKFQQLWKERDVSGLKFKNEVNVFRFGNGHQEVSNSLAELPVGIGGRRGVIQAALVEGDAPLLISRPALKTLGAELNFGEDSLRLFNDRVKVPLSTNSAGQYVVDVLSFSEQQSKVGTFLMPRPRTGLLHEELDQFPPELLVLCPPCTNAGGWFNLNSCYMPIHEVLRRKLQLKRFTAFCKRLILQQIKHGGRFMFEHPKGSSVWKDDDEMDQLCQQFHVVEVDMCCYDLHLPAIHDRPKQLVKKATRLLVSHEDMTCLHRQCPGDSSPAHRQHATVAGQHPAVGSVSQHVGKYTPKFVQAVLRTIPNFNCQEVLLLDEEVLIAEHMCHEVFASSVANDDDDDSAPKASEDPDNAAEDKIVASLLKLHKNLSHPSNQELVRVLKHGQASEKAIALAKQLKCQLCESRKAPTIPPPAQTSRVVDFNQRIGIDVKFLPGWKVNQKVKALNIVDQASSFQLMIPFFETETAGLLRKLLNERWFSWAGNPKEIVMDPARTNLGQALTEPTELEGTHISATAAAAHWQLGKTEVHGGLFAKVLEKVLAERSPTDQTEWLDCVRQCHVKNTTIQTYGFSPCQHVFGQNDLLSDPQAVIPCTASLQDDAIARSYATRAAARKALVELQDSKGLRRALAARPRKDLSFSSDDIIAYWRDQKWNNGKLTKGGRWYGSGVVIGRVGKNVIIAHRNHILRRAPEQLRMATNEEKTLVSDPANELLGIKDLIEGGTFRSSQYVDLLHQAYPPSDDVAMCPEGLEVRAEALGRAVSESPQEAQPVDSDVAMPEVPVDVPTDVSAGPSSNVTEKPQDEVNEAVIDKSPAEVVPAAASQSSASQSESTYGPMRRIPAKSGPLALYRPMPVQHDDFVEVMQEVLPQLLEEATRGTKRESQDDSEAPAPKHARGHESHVVQHEVLSVRHELSRSDAHELWDSFQKGCGTEVLIAQYMQKRAQKELPHSGIPGAEGFQLVEVLGNVYGQNDAPAAWYKAFDSEVLKTGFQRSKYDPCLYFLRCPKTNRLLGVLGSNVDDTATAGDGPEYQQALAQLRRRFPYRKWRVREGEFCGAHYKQNDDDMSIMMTQEGFAEGLKPAYIPTARRSHRTATLNSKEVSVLRAINGSLNWLAGQTRPDLSSQTSLSQQAFPAPTVHHLCEANNVIRRAKQHKELGIRFLPIEPSKLRLVCHADAAFANVGAYTQAGYVIGFTTDTLDTGEPSPWTPAIWRSFRLPRAVGSTLAAEAQSMVSATGTLEWASLILAEAIDGPFDVRTFERMLKVRTPVIVTDCKSLYDHLVSVSSPTAVEDRDDSASEWSEIDGGNMSDSSKRRLEADAPRPHLAPPRRAPRSICPENLAMWGMTLIEFGKLASKNIQYEELALATDKDNVSYRKWCKSQVDAAEGRLKDLALYLWAYDHETGQIDQRPVIPGTSDVRRFKGD
eukprot:s60_g3.t1